MAGKAWQHSTVMSQHTQGKKQTLLITFHTDNLIVHFGARECGILADIHNYVCIAVRKDQTSAHCCNSVNRI